MSTNDESVLILDVWHFNFQREIGRIREFIVDYPFVAIDSEFSGIVGEKYPKNSNQRYENLKRRIKFSKLIQLGITLTNKNGDLPANENGKYCVWQFNFREFNVEVDASNPASIGLLVNSGIDFEKNRKDGVGFTEFGEALMSSGVVLCDDVEVVTFHGDSDCGYLMKMLSGRDGLPESEEEFLKLLKFFFPHVYDIKHLIRNCNGLYGGLESVAGQLGVKRIGTAHQAGSDSLLTSSTLMRLKELRYQNGLPEKDEGVLFGYGEEYAGRNG